MDLGISKAINNGDGNTLIYTALIAACVSNFTPTVADGLYFNLQQKWEQEKELGIMTPERFWVLDAIGYYGITAGYYALILLTMVALGKTDYSTKSKILLSIVGGGLVIGVVMKNAQKDRDFEANKNSSTTTTALPDNTTTTTISQPPTPGATTVSLPASNETQTIMTIGGSAIGVAALVHMFAGKPVYSIAAGILGGIGGYLADQQIQNKN